MLLFSFALCSLEVEWSTVTNTISLRFDKSILILMCYICINTCSRTAAMDKSTCNYLEERRRVQQSPITTQTDDEVDAVGDIIKTCGQGKTPLYSVSRSVSRSRRGERVKASQRLQCSFSAAASAEIHLFYRKDDMQHKVMAYILHSQHYGYLAVSYSLQSFFIGYMANKACGGVALTEAKS